MFKREHFENNEKCFLFHFESSFGSWDNQVLFFQIFKCHDVIKCLSKKHKTFYWITWKVNTIWYEIWPSSCKITKEKISKNSMKNAACKLALGLFKFQRILCKKKPEKVCMLIWTNFDGFVITYLILVACFKKFIFQ